MSNDVERGCNMQNSSDFLHSLMQDHDVVDLADQDDLSYFVTQGTVLHW